MISPCQDAIKRGYIAKDDQLVYQRETVLPHSGGRTCHEIALMNRLSATVEWDRCMDLSRLSYQGIPIGWLAKGDDGSDASLPFERRFIGGMLYTCGLGNVGPAEDFEPMHGRIHLQSAEMRSVRLDSRALTLQGRMRESALFGENLLLERTLTFPLASSEVLINDVITNQSPRPQPYMLLYHINLGYPMLSEHLRLRLPEGTETDPATEHARGHLEALSTFAPPDPDFEEQDFYHRLPVVDSHCGVSAENPALGIGMRIRYRADTLPYLIEWKCLRSGDYVLGLEPSNNRVCGRSQALTDGSIQMLRPFESVWTEVALSFYPLETQKGL